MISDLLTSPNKGVTLSDEPTVLSAETVSKVKASIEIFGSNILNKKTDIKITVNEKIMVAFALRIESSDN